MGAICCCPRVEFEDHAHPSNFIYRNCICLRYFFHQLFTGYGALFQRLEGRAITSSVQGCLPLAITGLNTPSGGSLFPHSHNLVPRPIPYDTDARYSRLQREGLVLRHEKSLSHGEEENEEVRRTSSSLGVEHLVKKRNVADFGEECNVGNSSMEKLPSLKSSYTISYVHSTSEDEDVCPTCLEEYTDENPKIVAQCSHSFHLGCIYEWMERSDNCPICGMEMEFCQSP